MEGPQVRFHENGGGSSEGSPYLTHSKKYRKRKTRSGRKVPDRPGHFNPISQEGKDILDPSETAEHTAKKPKVAIKEKTGKKTIAIKGKKSVKK